MGTRMSTVYRVVLLALENLFFVRMDDQLEIWERKTWIVTERSWNVSASCNPVFSSLEKWDISFPSQSQIGSFKR